jgi:lipoate synthase
MYAQKRVFEEGQRGAVKIGRTGTKLHPAIVLSGSVMICCQCPNVANGWANHKATFIPNAERTCRT